MDAASETEIIRVFLVSRVIQITEAGTTSFVSPGNNALRRNLVHERPNNFHEKVMSSVCDGRVILEELRFRTNSVLNHSTYLVKLSTMSEKKFAL